MIKEFCKAILTIVLCQVIALFFYKVKSGIVESLNKTFYFLEITP